MWLDEHALTLQQLTASVPPEKRIPAPLPGSRPVSALLPAAASNGNGNGNGNGKTAASNIVSFTPASNGAAAAVASELDAGVQSLLKPLKVCVAAAAYIACNGLSTKFDCFPDAGMPTPKPDTDCQNQTRCPARRCSATPARRWSC